MMYWDLEVWASPKLLLDRKENGTEFLHGREGMFMVTVYHQAGTLKSGLELESGYNPKGPQD